MVCRQKIGCGQLNMHDSFLPETKAPKVFLRIPSNTKGEIVMPAYMYLNKKAKNELLAC